MANEPARKRPVSASRTSAPKKQTTSKPATRSRRIAPRPPLLDDEPTTPNYALRLTDGLDDEEAPSPTVRRGLRPSAPADADTFSDRLSEALAAISAAQGREDAEPPPPKTNTTWLEALDKLPPIKLPIGPAIPWRLGLPLLVALVIVMGVMSRSAGSVEQPGVSLPPQPTYPAEQAPLFTNSQPIAAPTPAVDASPTDATQPIGVAESPGLGIDFVDIGIKLVAVLALAYGSLMLLKKIGVGGAGAGKGDNPNQGVRVISSLALAPNRSVHVIRVPGGRTLLVGATPNAVNLIADLGEVAEDETPDASTFFDVLKGRIGK